MRINIVGCSGSGKTTFGSQLAGILDIPFIEMDALFWEPEWKAPEDEDFFSILEQALEGESWVLDGNYSRTIPLKWHRVQAVVWIDYSFLRTFYQAVTRAASRIVSQEELWPGTGNRETLRSLLSKDSIVLYTITSYHRKKAHIRHELKKTENARIHFHRICSPNQAKNFLERVAQDQDLILNQSGSC